MAASYCAVTLASFMLASQSLDENNTDTGHLDVIGTVLVTLVISTLLFNVLVLLFWDCDLCPKAVKKRRLGHKLCRLIGGKTSDGGAKNVRKKVVDDPRMKTKVTPVRVTSDTGPARAEELRRIRKKHGANSKEYQKAASLGSEKTANNISGGASAPSAAAKKRRPPKVTHGNRGKAGSSRGGKGSAGRPRSKR
jgi:hypothetical protein